MCRFCEDCMDKHPNMSLLSVRINTLSSTAAADDIAGSSRGLEKFFQSLGKRLEHSVGTAMNRVGFGPASVERKALMLIRQLRGHSRYVRRWGKKTKLIIHTDSEISQMEEELRKCCESLVDYLRLVLLMSSSPSVTLD